MRRAMARARRAPGPGGTDGPPPGRRREWGESGQSTLEYALVLLAFLAMVVGLASVWAASRDGRLLSRARDASSHGMGQGITVGFLQDVTAY